MSGILHFRVTRGERERIRNDALNAGFQQLSPYIRDRLGLPPAAGNEVIDRDEYLDGTSLLRISADTRENTAIIVERLEKVMRRLGIGPIADVVNDRRTQYLEPDVPAKFDTSV